MLFSVTKITLLLTYNFYIVFGRFSEECIDSEFCNCIKKQDGLPDMILQCQNLESESDLHKLTNGLWEYLVPLNVVTTKSKSPLYSELQITNSNIPNISHNVLLNICYFKTLNLSHNSLHRIEPRTFTCNITERLEELDLSNNNLTEIQDWFLRSSNLKKLYLERNSLSLIKPNAFVFLVHLQILNLSHNGFSVIKDGFFHNLTTLKILTLAHNKIAVIESAAFEHLPALHALDLSSNSLQYLNASVFLPLHKLTHLSLAHNQLVLFDVNDFKVPAHLRDLHIEGNPWACNNSMMWLFHLLQSSPVELAPNRSNVLCFSPEDMQNKTVHQWIEVKSMEESFHKINTCHVCDCSVDKDKIVGVVDCQGKALSHLPELLPNNTKIVHMENNNIKFLAANTVFLDEWQNVMYLYLDNNVIESLKGIEGTRLVQNLALLQLTRNKLKEIPIHILDQFSETLHDLYLGDNPWDCDCNTVRFQNWLRYHHKQVRDIEKISCGFHEMSNSGKTIYNLMKSDMCPQAAEGINYLDILNVVMAILIVTILSKLILDYWWQKRTGKLPHFFSFRLH